MITSQRVEAKLKELNEKLEENLPKEDSTSKSFEFKWNFNYFQINNQEFIREMCSETEDEKNNQKHRKKRATIEVYGILVFS